jgi:hypothetical protein
MKDEGLESTASKGIGGFFFAAIPWVLAAGASGWLAFYMMFHESRKELSQEERRAIYVGAKDRPSAKIQVVLEPGADCLHVVKIDYDAPELMVYVENHCSRRLEYPKLKWLLASPDGTSLRDGHDYCPAMMANGKSECRAKTQDYFQSTEDRAASLHVWMDEN